MENKRLILKKGPYIRMQLLIYCHLNNVHISLAELSMLTLLGIVNEVPMANFCKKVVELRILTSAGGTRHALDKLTGMGIVMKKEQQCKGKLISLNPDMGIQQKGVINYRIEHEEVQKD